MSTITDTRGRVCIDIEDDFEVSRTQSTWITWEHRTGSVCASDLGLTAGQWPERIRVQSSRTGHTLRFWRHTETVEDGELISVTYLAVLDGLYVTLVIFND